MHFASQSKLSKSTYLNSSITAPPPAHPGPTLSAGQRNHPPNPTGRKTRASAAHRDRLDPPATNPTLRFGPRQKHSRVAERSPPPPWRRQGRRAATPTCRRRRQRGWRPRCGATSTASRRGARPSRRVATRRRTLPRRLAPGTVTCRSFASSRTSRRSPRSAPFSLEFSVCLAVEIVRSM
jgi:hypothetical protein